VRIKAALAEWMMMMMDGKKMAKCGRRKRMGR
jgi:hypothetical protein